MRAELVAAEVEKAARVRASVAEAEAEGPVADALPDASVRPSEPQKGQEASNHFSAFSQIDCVFGW